MRHSRIYHQIERISEIVGYERATRSWGKITMIPKNIKGEHILKAIEEIERVGTPNGRSSKRFLLKYNDKHYSPKYVISLANKYANGKELDPSEFSGGKESNNFLRYLGFNAVGTQSSERRTPKPSIKDDKILHRQPAHDERCPRCKETITAMLEKTYGKVETNYKFEIGTYPENIRNLPYYDNLNEIYEALQNHRGFKDFVKTKTLPNCDFFVPNPRFIVEFDESQHFTLLRKTALEHYPEKLELGFERKRWVALCERINAKDNDPLYRDEQRAWYDTLRDFLPAIKGLRPTVRLFARDFEWCSLDPCNLSDIKRFESILKRTSKSWEIEVREDFNPFLARIIIADEWDGNLEEARKLLEDICQKRPKGKRVKFVITCGGVIQFDWPEPLSRMDIGDNKNPNKGSVDALVKEAKKFAKFVLSNSLDEKLREFTDYITLGIDSYKEKISTTQNYINQPHIELVFLIDLRNNCFYCTGKSYPTPNQQSGLVRISDLNTHFFDLDDVGKIMILACHDLTIFNPRSQNAKGWRKEVNKKFKELAKKERPIYALQHPHTTVKRRTWLNAWNRLRKTLPSVEKYAGRGRYYEPDRKRSEYDDLNNVLKSTKYCNTIDLIVRKNKEEK